MPETLRLGRMAFTNVTPLEAAFDLGVFTRDANITAGVPSALNAAMDAGELDVSPMSAAHYLANADRYVRLGDLGIVARGAVLSVVLASPIPPSLLGGAEVAVTADSASGRVLLEALLSKRYGVEAVFTVVDDAFDAALQGRPTLLIGDAALDAGERLASETIYDLGHAWRDWSGLPMVFAVWAARADVAASRPDDIAALVARYRDARAWGVAHRADVIAVARRARPRTAAFYDRYFTALDHMIDAPAEAGLAAFGRAIDREILHVTR